MRSIFVALALMFGLGACVPEDRPAPPQAAAFAAADCTAAGGVPTAGRAGPVCARPTKDAGKSCNNSTQCESFCLAETKSCAPHRPYFGCFAVLNGGAGSPTICVD